MSWITATFSMTASSCLTLALIYGFIWWRRRDAWAHLLFAVAAIATATLAWFDLAAMHAQSAAQFSDAVRWAHVSVWAVILALAGFVKLYLRAGRTWLLWTVCALRTISLFLNFATGENLNYRILSSLTHVQIFGQAVSIAHSQPNPWMLIGHLSIVGMLIFVIDAAISAWRRGHRRTAIMIGGSIAVFLVAGTAQALLIFWASLPWPATPSLFFLGIIVVMGYELSSEASRAEQLAHALRSSEQRITLAAEAGNMGFWSRDPSGNEFWATDQWRLLFGFASADRPRVDDVLQRLHPDDRETAQRAFVGASEADGRYQAEYRLLMPDGQIRWIASNGRVELNNRGQAVLMQGVSLDITQRKQAEHEAQRHRGEIAHLLRVANLGELSASLAHELKQPLTAIMHNAHAAQLYLAQDKCDLQAIREILGDIVTDDQRAAEVIERLRTLLKKGDFLPQALVVNELIQSVLKLLHYELMARSLRVVLDLGPGLPRIRGDCVQLQQVLINLILNAADAMSQTTGRGRILTLRAHLVEADAVTLSVADTGIGIPAGCEEKIFESYYTTKPHGLGLGLSLSRSIVLAHGGCMWAEKQVSAGAAIHFSVPNWNGESRPEH
jgi:two-component system, LuxR family, sensor kinase FixL